MKGTWISVMASAALVCSALLVPTTSQAIELARTGQKTLLRDTPMTSGKPLVELTAGTDVRVLGRQTGWVRVDAAGQQGWLPDGHLKAAYAMKDTSPPPRSGFLSWFTAVLKPDAARVGTGGSAANRVSTATIGIRGLADDGAMAAKSNSEELQKLKLYSVSRLDAEDFGRNAQLVQRNVAYSD